MLICITSQSPTSKTDNRFQSTLCQPYDVGRTGRWHTLIYRWGKWSMKRLGGLAKLTLLTSEELGLIQIFLLYESS